MAAGIPPCAFPPCLEYMSDQVTRITPEWSLSLCAPGNQLELDGSKVTATEAAGKYRCASTEVGYGAPGRYMMAFRIESAQAKSGILLGVRTHAFQYTTESTYPGQTGDGWAYCTCDGHKYHAGTNAACGEPAVSGDIIGVLFDLVNGTLEFFKNGARMGIAHSLPAGVELFPCVATFNQGDSITTMRIQEPAAGNLGQGTGAGAWVGDSMTAPLPPCLSFIRNRVTCETPIWDLALCAPGNVCDLDGRKVLKREPANAHRCVSAVRGYRGPGKYYFSFAIEDSAAKAYIMFGVRTDAFRYTTESTYPGHTGDGWAYYAHNGTKYHAGNSEAYGEPAKSGDIVGMLLDLDVGRLCFLKNGAFMGPAHVLPRDVEFFPCVATYEQGHSVVTLSTESGEEDSVTLGSWSRAGSQRGDPSA